MNVSWRLSSQSQVILQTWASLHSPVLLISMRGTCFCSQNFQCLLEVVFLMPELIEGRAFLISDLWGTTWPWYPLCWHSNSACRSLLITNIHHAQVIANAPIHPRSYLKPVLCWTTLDVPDTSIAHHQKHKSHLKRNDLLVFSELPETGISTFIWKSVKILRDRARGGNAFFLHHLLSPGGNEISLIQKLDFHCRY